MSPYTPAHTSGYRFLRALAVGVAVLQSLPAPTAAQQATMETLLDRIQIEDLLVRYYYISSDSGLPDRFDQTFKQRDNPLAPL